MHELFSYAKPLIIGRFSGDLCGAETDRSHDWGDRRVVCVSSAVADARLSIAKMRDEQRGGACELRKYDWSRSLNGSMMATIETVQPDKPITVQ